MSPILKRDVSEHIRQARRLASAITNSSDPSDYDHDPSEHHSVDNEVSSSSVRVTREDPMENVPPDSKSKGKWRAHSHNDNHASDVAGNGVGAATGHVADSHATLRVVGTAEDDALRISQSGEDGADDDDGSHGHVTPTAEESEGHAMLGGRGRTNWNGRIREMGYSEPLDGELGGAGGKDPSKWKDLRNLLFECTPSLLLSLIGLVFTGELLEHLARWRVFRRVDELFILVPMIGNLKGNLEMCLSARLGTSANIGELDHRHTRRALLNANMTLLCLQALLISSLAAFLSFILGLITRHRLGDRSQPGGGYGDDAGLGVGDGEWHEGYTRPGWKQLVMVLATGMAAAGCSATVLGYFMSSLVVVSRWFGLDPDNITPPLAACLGDLLTLFILACIGTLLVGTMDTPIPLLAVIIMCVAVGWFLRRVLQNEWIKKVARGAWAPLIVAMLIASGAGMVLDLGVGRYRGFALLSISMGGLTGSIGAVHANRLSTMLHTKLHNPSSGDTTHSGPSNPLTGHLTPEQNLLTLYLLSFPCQACFLAFVSWANWIDLSLGWAGWICFALTAAISLGLAHYLTHFFWARDLDPDSYTLPIHSALVDFIASMILMVAYEICIARGLDVMVHVPSASTPSSEDIPL